MSYNSIARFWWVIVLAFTSSSLILSHALPLWWKFYHPLKMSVDSQVDHGAGLRAFCISMIAVSFLFLGLRLWSRAVGLVPGTYVSFHARLWWDDYLAALTLVWLFLLIRAIGILMSPSCSIQSKTHLPFSQLPLVSAATSPTSIRLSLADF